MKKKISIILSVLIATALFTACSAASGNITDSTGSNTMPMPAEATTADDMFYDYFGVVSTDLAESDWAGESLVTLPGGGSGGLSQTAQTAPATEGFTEKIIYSYYAEIETLEYVETIANVTRLIETHGAFIENSSESGSSLGSERYGGHRNRYAYFVIRVPVNQLDVVTSKLDTLGNVVHRNSNAENITAQFTDTQSRFNALRVQEERLLDMLSKTDNVPDLIIIEERLSYVRYETEWLQTTLNNWQRQVDYSTLTLSISEVGELTQMEERTYWQQMGDGILATIRGVGRFFSTLFMWLIVSAPVLIILAVIAIVVIFIVRTNLRKSKAKNKNARNAAYQYTYNNYPQPQTQEQQTTEQPPPEQ